MESNKIYEEAKEEMSKIKKTLGSSQTVIDWTKLDERSKAEINTALTNAVCKRLSEVDNVILGVQ